MTKKNVIKLYNELAEKWGCHYKLEFNNRKSQTGYCNYGKKIISMSISYIENNPEKLIKNTILHEIAHMLTKSGHDRKWKLKCKEIGCNSIRLNYEAVIPAEWIGICPECKNETRRHRKTKVACGICCRKYNNGEFTKKYLLKYQKNTIRIIN